MGGQKNWRRGRDSNPPYPCECASFRVRCIQRLCPLSAGQNRAKKHASDGGYLTKHAGTDKGCTAYIVPGWGELWTETAAPPRFCHDIRPHPQATARHVLDSLHGRRDARGAL